MALETLFYHNRNLCWIFDLETHRFVAVNNKCVEVLGYDEDEFLHRLIIDQFFPNEFDFRQISRLSFHLRAKREKRSISVFFRNLREIQWKELLLRRGHVSDRITCSPRLKPIA